MQDEPGTKSGNWVGGFSTSFPIFCGPVRGNNARRLLAASRLIPCTMQITNRLDKGKSLCRTSECPQIFYVERFSCKSLFDFCQRNCEYTDGYV